MRKAPPLPFHRALFIAALCTAAASVAKVRTVSKREAQTPARIDRRDRSIRFIVQHQGRSIIAAQSAIDAFEQRGKLYALPDPPAPTFDPRVAAIMADAAVRDALGEVAAHDQKELAWVEYKPEPPRVSIYWRGEAVRGERVVRTIVTARATGEKRIEKGRARHTVGGIQRELDRERFGAGVEAAALALDAAGFRPSGLIDIRWLKVGVDESEVSEEDFDAAQAKGGFHFKGMVATIGLRRELPKYLALTKLCA